MIRYFIVLLLLLFTQFGFAQVGIGTTTPTPGYDLDVNGSLLVQDEFKMTDFPNGTVQNNDYKFLVRLLNSVPPGEVAQLDLTQTLVAPVNVADYVFTNLQSDNVTAVDLQFDADKYIVGLSNFRYVGQEIVKGSGGRIGNFVSRVYVPKNATTWHIEMRNRTRDAANNNTITYYVTLIVYDKNYFKALPAISGDLNGTNSGSALSPAGL